MEKRITHGIKKTQQVGVWRTGKERCRKSVARTEVRLWVRLHGMNWLQNGEKRSKPYRDLHAAVVYNSETFTEVVVLEGGVLEGTITKL